jgi:tetratricopeptide (TPR) repeat protein
LRAGRPADHDRLLTEAYGHYSQATGLNERHEPSRQGRLRILLVDLGPGERELALHHWGKARDFYGKAFTAHPGNWLAAYKYGTLSVTPFGDTATGIAALKEAARLAVNEASVYLALGRAQASVGRFGEARDALEYALMFDPKNPEIRTALEQDVAALGAGAPPVPPPPAPPRVMHNVAPVPAKPAARKTATKPGTPATASGAAGSDELDVK